MCAPNCNLQPIVRLALLALLSSMPAGVACADDVDPAARVARVAHLAGEVSIEPAGLDDWTAADLNRPLSTGDKIWSDKDSRAELDIGSAVIRLGTATGFSFLNLDDQTAQLQVTAGTVSVQVRTLAQNETIELDTPNSAVSLLGPGDYRVDVNDAGDTSIVKVSGGTAEVTAGGQTLPVHLQQQVTLTGTAEVAASVTSLGTPDAFDAWTFERERRAQLAQVSNYVAPEVIGAQELNDYGTWLSTPDEGYVWAPSAVAVDWAPYHDGHWIWITPWGWTWVDAAPWGFAPFHYGRWISFSGRWCWVPGPRSHRPVYAPALVAWLGAVPGGGPARYGGPRVAWFALGPREIYVPAYPASQSYLRNVNAHSTLSSTELNNLYNNNVRNIHYVNQTIPGAITAVTAGSFTAAQSVARNAIRLAPGELAAAMPTATAPPITPARESVLGAGVTVVRVARPPLGLQNRQVVAKTTPPAALPPFSTQQHAIQAHGGRPVARSELAPAENYPPVAAVRMAVANAAAESSGMTRAARPESRPGAARPPVAAPALAQESAVSAPAREAPAIVALTPARAAAPVLRADRPPTATGQPGSAERPRLVEAPRPVERRGTTASDTDRGVYRPSAASPAAVRALPPAMPVAPPATLPPPLQATRPPAAHANAATPASSNGIQSRGSTRNN